MMATTWTVSLAPGTASLAPVMVRLAPPGTTSLSTGDSKSGTRGGVSGTRDRVRQAWHRGRYNPGTSEPEPGNCDQGAPGTADGAGPGTVCLLAMIWTMHEPGTGDDKHGTRDGAVQCTCAHTRLLPHNYTRPCYNVFLDHSCMGLMFFLGVFWYSLRESSR